MSTKHIPQDIIDCIIFFLRGETKTLFATSIVSKAWINPSHRHLFHKLKVEHPRGAFPLDFLAFIETHPQISIYIKQLRIQADVDNDAFPKLLAALPNLSVLSILDFFSPMRKVAGPVEKRYTLEYLLLDVMTPGDNDDYYYGREDEEATMAGLQWDPSLIDATRVSNLLSLFSSIEELDLRDAFTYRNWSLTSPQIAEIIPDHRRGKLAVKAFKSSHSPSQSYFEFFNRILDLGALEELVIRCNDFPAFTALGTLIRESTSLWKISFELNGEYLGEDVSTMGLGSCLSLRHLFIQPLSYSLEPRPGLQIEEAQAQYEWSGAQRILDTDLRRLHHLSIQVRRLDTVPNSILGCLESVNWEWLDEKIIVEMPDLECVEFLYEAEDPKKRTVDSAVRERKLLEEYIFERLPKARRGGLVRIGNAIELLKVKNLWINDYYIYELREPPDF